MDAIVLGAWIHAGGRGDGGRAAEIRLAGLFLTGLAPALLAVVDQKKRPRAGTCGKHARRQVRSGKYSVRRLGAGRWPQLH